MSGDNQTLNLSSRPFIGGQWVDGNGGKLPNVDPGDGSKLGSVSLADGTQIEAALAAADAAFPAWSRTLASARGAVLTRAAEILRDRLEDAAATLLLETGKTKTDARAEILRSIENLAWNGAEAGRLTGTIFPGLADGSRRASVPTALGVAVVITAWNFPAALATRKLGAALGAGCTVVFKASEAAPATARMIVESLIDAGLPAGAVNLVFGEPAAVSRQLLTSSIVKVMSFTGSTRVGRILAELAAPNLLRTVLELGGHAPVIVAEDADIDGVIAVTAPAKYGSAGQSCVAPSRYIVHTSLYARFVEAFTEKSRSYVLGHGNEDGTTMGAVIDQGRVDALVRLADDARSKGATVTTGGHQINRTGFYFAPTVVADVPAGAELLSEEPFGPISAVVPFSDLDAAITKANAAPYSFAAYLFTDSMHVRDTVTRGLNASNIGVNQMAPSQPDAPLGGLGNSGYGYEGGREGILAFTQLRLVSESAPA